MHLSLPRCPLCIVASVARISLGLSLLFVGLVLYMNFTSSSAMMSEDLAFLSFLGSLWAYILPALMIIGGSLFALGMFRDVAVWAASIAIGSIPVGMLLKSVLSGLPLTATMPMTIDAFVWLIALVVVIKVSEASCAPGCCDETAKS